MEHLVEYLVGGVGTILIFGAIILFHEFGHFIVAKRTGMLVHEFSLGFGPAIFQHQVGDTLYAIRILPIGGFVRIAGMEPGEEDEPNGFDKKPYWAKFSTILAGVTMNFVLAFLVIIMLGMLVGFPMPGKRIFVEGVMPNSPAERAGVQPGDEVLRLNGKRVVRIEDMTATIRTSHAVALTVARTGKPQPLTFSIRTAAVPTAERHGLIYHLKTYSGIGVALDTLSGGWQREGLIDSIKSGAIGVKNTLYDSVAQFVSLVSGHISAKYLGGPVQIMQLSYNASKSALISRMGAFNLLNKVAIISIFIGFFNLLPIPALDGSRLLFLTVEAAIGRPFNREKEAMVHLVGMAILLGFVLLITVKDVIGIFRR